ncbi:MAG: ABC transporter ATP-binding protein [Cohaesibacteraceae bacterium]
MTLMLSLAGAGVQFAGKPIFVDLDLEIHSGEVLAVLGPNGRGKTTLIRTLVGTLQLSSGERQVLGTIGYVPQSNAPTFDFTVRDMVLMGRARHIGVFGSPGRQDFSRADLALERLGIADLANRGVVSLSGGERQLVMVAQALAGECDCLILDEPASALDLKNQAMLFDVLADLAHVDGLGVAFTTHVPGHALEAADRALLLMETDRKDGPVADIISHESLTALYGTEVRVLREQRGASSLAAAVAVPARSRQQAAE